MEIVKSHVKETVKSVKNTPDAKNASQDFTLIISVLKELMAVL